MKLVALTCSERDERGLLTVVVPGGACALPTLCGSAVGGSGRRAVILRARIMVRIELSVHEREPRFFSRDQRNVQERRAHLHASPEWTNISSEVVQLFAHGARTGVSCTQKVSLCDAMICVVASDFFVASLARRPMCGQTPLLINLGRTGCDVAEKFGRVVGIETLQLAFTGGLNYRTRRRFLRRRCPDCHVSLL